VILSFSGREEEREKTKERETERERGGKKKRLVALLLSLFLCASQ
jgi:hypothetical protein